MSGQRRICFLSASHPAEDKRVFHKEARSLAGAGFDVVHLCPGEERNSYVKDSVRIETYPRRAGKLSRLVGLLDLYRGARAIDADAYHCNEPDSWIVGVALRATRRRRVVFDCHEHYPGQVARWLPPGTRVVGRFVTRVVLQVLGLVTHLIVLAKPSVSDDFSLSRRRQLLVLNTTSLAYATSKAPASASERDTFTFVHFGVFRRERGSEQLLGALYLLWKWDVDVRVRLIGQFTDGSRDSFFAKASAHGIVHLIEDFEWMPFDEAFPLVASSDAGLVLFQGGVENNVRGLPHKMFDYMIAGLPVIGPSFAPDIAAIIQQADAGVLLDTGDVHALATAMRQLVEDSAETRRLGVNARRAVVEIYNWEAEAAKLIDAYEQLLPVRPSASRR